MSYISIVLHTVYPFDLFQGYKGKAKEIILENYAKPSLLNRVLISAAILKAHGIS
jgi:hypothetical protein